MLTAIETSVERRRLIALEDARAWLDDAVRHFADGDYPAACYAVHTGIKHANDAHDDLVELLVWDGRADDEP